MSWVIRPRVAAASRSGTEGRGRIGLGQDHGRRGPRGHRTAGPGHPTDLGHRTGSRSDRRLIGCGDADVGRFAGTIVGGLVR